MDFSNHDGCKDMDSNSQSQHALFCGCGVNNDNKNDGKQHLLVHMESFQVFAPLPLWLCGQSFKALGNSESNSVVEKIFLLKSARVSLDGYWEQLHGFLQADEGWGMHPLLRGLYFIYSLTFIQRPYIKN